MRYADRQAEIDVTIQEFVDRIPVSSNLNELYSEVRAYLIELQLPIEEYFMLAGRWQTVALGKRAKKA